MTQALGTAKQERSKKRRLNEHSSGTAELSWTSVGPVKKRMMEACSVPMQVKETRPLPQITATAHGGPRALPLPQPDIIVCTVRPPCQGWIQWGGWSPAMGYRCVCTTGTVRHKAEVQSKSQREKLFGDMPKAPFAAVGKQVQSMRSESTASKSYELNPGRMTYHRVQRTPRPRWTPQSTRPPPSPPPLPITITITIYPCD